MKIKFNSKIFTDVAKKYELNIYYVDDDFYVVVKKIISVKEPFISAKGKYLINDGYYIVEIIPKKENYTMRVFINDKKEILEYYFDITYKNTLDKKSNIPYYYDLYLDITIDKNGNIDVLDENELKEALDNNKISKRQFNLANKTKDLLLDSIINKTNKYLNLDLEKYFK